MAHTAHLRKENNPPMHDHPVIRCLIADDEPPAREIIKRYVENMPMLQLVGECGNAIQVIGFLQQHAVDLLFLDIRMPQLSGIDLLKTMKNPPAVIFTTAHAEYALDGYELDVVDFLLKPIPFDRFVKAVNKVMQPTGLHLVSELPKMAVPPKNDAFIYFRADRKMVKVMLADILYIESMKDYVKVLTTRETIITKQSMGAVEAMLPTHMFIRTHRSFIVSLQQIKSFTNELIDIGQTELPIGKLYRNEVLKILAAV